MQECFLASAGCAFYYPHTITAELVEAYSGVVNYDPYHPVNDHPRKHRKTRPVVYL